MAVSYYQQHRPREATVTVSQGDTGQNQDYSGDFIGDGTADDVEIQAATTFVEALGGGSVFILNGDYDITATLTSAVVPIAFFGVGYSTNLVLSVADINCFLLDQVGDHSSIINLRITGTGGGTGHGIMVGLGGTNADECLFENLYITLMGEKGIYITNNSQNCIVSTCHFFDNGDDGAHTENPHTSFLGNISWENGRMGLRLETGDQCIVVGNICHDNDWMGITVSTPSTNFLLTGNVCYSNTLDGINVNISTESTITGNMCNDNARNGILIDGSADDCVISGNTCNTNTLSGIVLDTVTGCVVDGNICQINVRYGIYLDNGDQNVISNNSCIANDSGDTATYDGIYVDADSIDNDIIGNICRENHRYGINVDGSRNQIVGNNCSENDRHGIIFSGAHVSVTGNTCYNNGQDAVNTWDGINNASGFGRGVIVGNLCLGNNRQRHGIALSNTASFCLVSGNLCYFNVADGINLGGNNDSNSIVGNYLSTNGAYGIHNASATNNDNLIKNNYFDANGTAPILDAGTNTRLATLPIQMIQGTEFEATAGQPWGWLVDHDTDYALGIGWLPYEVQQVVRIRIIAVGLNTPGAGNYMRLQITGEGATFDELYTTEPIDVVDKNNEEVNFGNQDVINWVFTSADDADIADLRGGDSIQLKALHEGAGNSDIETDALIRSIQIEYV